MGIKPSDDCVLPLCNKCHFLQHNIGEVSFYGDGLEAATKAANDIYGKDDDAMSKIVSKLRCSIF